MLFFALNLLLCIVQKLNLPEYNFKIVKEKGQYTVWDEVRKKYIVLTPEEWVRQNFMKHLNAVYNYPISLMQFESGLKYNNMPMRSDVLCYNNSGRKVLLVECKRPNVPITQKTFDQIARYNMSLKVPFLAVTNGMEHFYCKIDFLKKDYIFLANLPHYQTIKDI